MGIFLVILPVRGAIVATSEMAPCRESTSWQNELRFNPWKF